MSWLFSVRAVTRLILTQSGAEVRLYALPLQIRPLKTPWHYATPPKFVKQTWQSSGPFLTLGWPQDTTALEEGFIDDQQFLQLCMLILEERQRIFMHHLDSFTEGLFAAVFDSLDRVQHMFLEQRPDIVEEWYVKLDTLVGQVEERLKDRKMNRKTKLVVLSDHGFGRFDHKVHLNRWLISNGYLAADENDPQGTFKQVDWTKTKAYAVGLNSIYLNLEGREGQGIVPTRILRMSIWELLGVISYTQAFALFETIVIVFLFLIAAFILPGRFLRDNLVLFSVIVMLIVTVWLVILHYNDSWIAAKNIRALSVWGVSLFIALALFLWVSKKWQPLQTSVVKALTALTVLAALYLIIDIFSILIILIRNLNF